MTAAETLWVHFQRYLTPGVMALRVDSDGLHVRCGRERLLIAHSEQVDDAFSRLHDWIAKVTREADGGDGAEG